ncbi:cytochrome P450 [Streptomyces sasae]|uniref:cytochrome P450 n=1 Tax=Streptomyces sasae TaxID=1266772 RepID=UPI003743D9A0
MRLESPVQGLHRTATRDTEFGGSPIPAGARLLVSFGAGNRDAKLVERPDELDLDRVSPHAHLAFGRGAHTCLGHALAASKCALLWRCCLARCDVSSRRSHRSGSPTSVTSASGICGPCRFACTGPERPYRLPRCARRSSAGPCRGRVRVGRAFVVNPGPVATGRRYRSGVHQVQGSSPPGRRRL